MGTQIVVPRVPSLALGACRVSASVGEAWQSQGCPQARSQGCLPKLLGQRQECLGSGLADHWQSMAAEHMGRGALKECVFIDTIAQKHMGRGGAQKAFLCPRLPALCQRRELGRRCWPHWQVLAGHGRPLAGHWQSTGRIWQGMGRALAVYCQGIGRALAACVSSNT